jgi:acyl-CoA synthetase (AMP-forming)/AMP-acid ligase II/acyl carrier protein
MERYQSLRHILSDAREKSREIRFINGEKDESILPFSELWDRAVTLLGAFQSHGMRAGDELVIFTRSNESFVTAFWAAILGGIVPVPVAVGISDEHRFKLFRILSQLNNGTLYTERELLDRLQGFAENHNVSEMQSLLKSRSVTEDEIDSGQDGELVEPDPASIAFIQYSSGSTSDPKGVCLTHNNLSANICGIMEGIQWNENERSLSWMPLTHDMGLIGYHLCAVSAGMDHAIMDTSVFVRRPLLWLQKASELKSTQLCSPNFGYKHFLKLFARKGIEDLDLSSVKLILNGAEPISWDLCEEFLDAMAPYGLKRSAMFPVYGLAEATLAVTFPDLGSEYSRILVHRHSLKIGEAYEDCEEGDDDAVSFLKVGKPIRFAEVRITDDSDRQVEDGVVGHIHIRGENVTTGIYNDDAAGAALFADDQWLRTGDCGVIVDGDLVITGRSKDIIIVNGQNYYPHDIEEIIAQLDGLDLGKVVVAGVSLSSNQTEELLAFVLYRQDVDSFRTIADSVRTIVGEHTGLEIDHVIPVSRIPKTTSGKVQRSHLATAYLDGEYSELVASLGGTTIDEDDLDDDPLVRELELICREFSKERRIGPDDNLFEVGVSSLTLTEIVLAVDEKYPGKLDISDLFDYPTVRELADFMRR